MLDQAVPEIVQRRELKGLLLAGATEGQVPAGVSGDHFGRLAVGNSLQKLQDSGTQKPERLNGLASVVQAIGHRGQSVPGLGQDRVNLFGENAETIGGGEFLFQVNRPRRGNRRSRVKNGHTHRAKQRSF